MRDCPPPSSCSRLFCPAVSTGIDSEGHAANFVETEQIVVYEGAKASFVQASMVTHPLVRWLYFSEVLF